MALLHLEVRNAVAHEAARLGVLLIDVNVMAGARELLRAGETRRTRSDDRDFLAGLAIGRLRLHPALLEGAVDDRAFDRLDRHRRVLNVERAGRLAGRRANAAGEFRKVVGREQIARRFPPIAAIGEVVPVGDLIVDRTADVTIGDAAIHAARRLVARRLLAQGEHELAIVADPVGGRGVTPVRAIDLQKPGHLAHSSIFHVTPPGLAPGSSCTAPRNTTSIPLSRDEKQD